MAWVLSTAAIVAVAAAVAAPDAAAPVVAAVASTGFPERNRISSARSSSAEA